jgi:uncharacterized protein (TIGR02722 family)
MKLSSILLALACGVASSCSSTGYRDPGTVETLGLDYSHTDLQQLAGGMSESLIGSQNLNYLDGPGKREDKRVIVYMGGVENLTHEHIDTGGVQDAIKTTLFKSGKFRFVAADQGQGEIGEQVAFQQGSGRVNPEMAKAFGKQLGADVVIYGKLRDITAEKSRTLETGGYKTETTFYQFNLECVNIETGELVWVEQKDLYKVQRTGIFGG